MHSKISGPTLSLSLSLSLTTLSKFLSPRSLALLLPWKPSHCHHLLSSIPALEHITTLSPVLEHTAASTPTSKHATTVLFLKPFVRRCWSLSRCRRRPRPRFPQSAPLPSSSSSPRHCEYQALNSFAVDDWLWYTMAWIGQCNSFVMVDDWLGCLLWSFCIWTTVFVVTCSKWDALSNMPCVLCSLLCCFSLHKF
jgi:hypothetical protein